MLICFCYVRLLLVKFDIETFAEIKRWEFNIEASYVFDVFTNILNGRFLKMTVDN